MRDAGLQGECRLTTETRSLESLTLHVDGAIATLTIARPRVRNAFTTAMWAHLRDQVRRLATNPDVRVLVLRGEGRTFTSGSDIGEFARLGPEGSEQSFRLMEEAITAVESLPFATIAAIGGHALGAGLELALACDLRIGAADARLGMPIARLGITVTPRFAARLVAAVGPARARDLLLTGRILAAEEARAAGLLHYVVDPAELEPAVTDLANRVAAQSPAAVRAAKRWIAALLPAVDDGDARAVDPVEFREGVAAFLEGRPPRF